MKRLSTLVAGVLVASAALFNPGVEAWCGPDMPPMRCPVAGPGKDAQPDCCPGGGTCYFYYQCSRKVSLKSPSLDYKGGKIYFCCEQCIPVFKKSPEKFAANANLQLVVTYQAMQFRCPLCGGDLKSAKEVTVNGVSLFLCSDECGKKIVKATPQERLQMIFGDAGFAKGFKMVVKAAAPAPKAAAPAPKAAAAPAPSATCDAAGESGCCCCQKQAVSEKRSRPE